MSLAELAALAVRGRITDTKRKVLVTNPCFSCSRCTGGSFSHLESRESPGGSCSILDETSADKLSYKKSVFKKRSNMSSANTVRKTKKEQRCTLPPTTVVIIKNSTEGHPAFLPH